MVVAGQGPPERGVYLIRFSGLRLFNRAARLRTGPLVQRLFGIDNPNDDFAVHQYGRCGIPSLSQIVTAVTNHEIGASSSHYSQGAAQMAQDNPGLVAEPVVGLPGTNPVTMANSVFNSLTPKFNAVIAAAAPEPPSNLPAGINYPNPSYLPCVHHDMSKKEVKRDFESDCLSDAPRQCWPTDCVCRSN